MMTNIKRPLNGLKGVAARAREISLAGLGAYGTAREASGRAFQSLVSSGTQAETRIIKTAGDKLEQFVADTTKRLSDLRSVLENQTRRALAKLDIAASGDIEKLIARIDALKAQVDALAKTR